MATNTTNLGMDYAGTSAPLFSEIFTKVNNAKVKEEKIKVLKPPRLSTSKTDTKRCF